MDKSLNSGSEDASTRDDLLTSGLGVSDSPEEIAATPQEVPPSEQEAAEEFARPSGALALLKVFKHRNYRLFFSGQIVSLIGTWLTSVAQGWLVYSLTHSPFLLGLTSFAGQVPVFFFSSLGGMIGDRVDRRRLLVVTQGLAMLQAATLAVLTLTGVVTVWEIIALALFKGFVNAVDVPTRQAFTMDMVGREDLRHAISLNSVMFNLARVIGPGIAGLLIALVGEGLCFTIDAISYGAVLISLLMMMINAAPKHAPEHPWAALKAGFIYAWQQKQIRVSLMLVAASSMFGAAYLSMMPAVARDVLHQGSQGLGLLMGSVGAGALMGAYTLSRIHERHLTLTPIIASLSFGIFLIAFSHSTWLPLSMFLLLPTAFSLMLLGGSTNTIIQTVASEKMRGRVVAFYAMFFMGMMPWGSLLLGWVADHFGVTDAISLGGMCVMGSAAFAWFSRARAMAPA